MTRLGLALTLLAWMGAQALSGEEKTARPDPREALRPFNHLIGTWEGTGLPRGTREEKDKGLWIESMDWAWQFKGGKVWLQVGFSEGKYFSRGELRHRADKDCYELTLQTLTKEKLSYSGKLENNRLILERADEKKKEDQRLVFSFLHANRFLYTYEVKPADKTLFKRVYQVGATKKGTPFAAGDGRPECVVSGGLGTIKVSYQGKTYYVCCSGCRAELKADPAKYVKEYERKMAKKKQD